MIPEQASNFAPNVDALMLFIVAICLFFAVAVTAAVIYFFFKYRRKYVGEIGVPIHGDMRLETAWIVVPLVLSMFMFAWGAVVYVDYRRSPNDTLDIYVIGKQWMWKIQQPTGAREINALHVPIDTPVTLQMTSEDVIHSFFVPPFRIKQDAVPGMHIPVWFQPTKLGTFELGCAELCGLGHYRMRAVVTVHTQQDYDRWVAERARTAAATP